MWLKTQPEATLAEQLTTASLIEAWKEEMCKFAHGLITLPTRLA
jgi:hypothetical protein